MYFCHIHSNNTVWCCKECVDQQLVDKERELTVSKQWADADKIELAKIDDLVTKLAAANAVVDGYKDALPKIECVLLQYYKTDGVSKTAMLAFKRKAWKLFDLYTEYKLQGGDSDGPEARNMR